MDRINGPGHVDHLFVAEDAEILRPPTEITAPWLNGIQEEPLAVIEGVGMVPDVNDNTQLRQAISKMIEARVGDYSLDTGAANAYVVAMNPAIIAYTGVIEGTFRALNANTGASTLNAGGGSLPLRRSDGTALQMGDIAANALVSWILDSVANVFLVKSIVASQAFTQAEADARYAPLAAGNPAGTIIEHAGTVAPSGYLICPTAQTNLSRSAYAALFAAIGTTWGVGDGATTFGMPWFPANYAAVQANSNVGTSTVGQVISHTHIYGAKSGTGAVGAAGGNGGADVTTDVTQATGGAANLAAGVRVLRCVKY